MGVCSRFFSVEPGSLAGSSTSEKSGPRAMWPKSLRCRPPPVGDGAEDRVGADLVPLSHGDPVGGERPLLPWPFVTLLTLASFGRRFGRHQERLAVAGLQRQRLGDAGHRDVVLAFVALDQLAEQPDSRTAEGVG